MTEAEKMKDVEKVKDTEKPKDAEKPDFDAYNEKLNTISKSIDDLKKNIDNLQKEIKIASKGKEEYNKKRKDIVNRIDAKQSEIDKLENERKTILEEIEKKQKHKKELKSNAQNMKRQIGFENEEDIEKKIKEIENKLMTTTIPIKEEKQLIAHIQVLNKSKPLLSSYSKIESEANKVDGEAIAPLKSRMDAIREQINKLRNEKKIERNNLKELQNSFQEKNTKLNELNSLRDGYSKKMNAFIMERRNITAEMEKKRQQYRAYKMNLVKARLQRIKEEKERRNLELDKQSLEKELEDIDLLPYREELALIENMLAYLKKFVDDPKQEESKKKYNNIKKENGDVEASSKTKEENNKKSKNKKAFKLDMNILCYFVTAGIEPPVSYDEVESCIAKLIEKKNSYESKRDESVKNVEIRKKDLMDKIKDIDEKLSNFKPTETQKNSKINNKVKA